MSRDRDVPAARPVRVEIIGAPISCGTETKDTWRDVALWAATQLRGRYGDAVAVEYHDLLEPDCPSLPEGTRLPLVFVDGRVISSGGKLSLPLIRQAIEAAGAARQIRVASPTSPQRRPT